MSANRLLIEKVIKPAQSTQVGKTIFADDINFINKDKQQLEDTEKEAQLTFQKWNLTINTSKTEWTIINESQIRR